MDHPPAGRLPVIIYEQIIDYLAFHYRDTLHVLPWERTDRRKALFACCLTSRLWLPRARHHLYNTITLYNPTELTRLVSLLREFPALAGYARVLNVFYPRGDHRSHTIPAYLSILLPNLQSITLTFNRWNGARPICFAMARKFTSVTSLRLSMFWFQTPRDFTRFILSFPKLTGLKVSDVHCSLRQPYIVSPKLLRNTPQLISLDHSGSHFGLLGSLHVASSSKSLEYLKVHCAKADIAGVEEIGQLLSGCASLEEFSLSLDRDINSFTEEALLSMDFSAMLNLRTYKYMVNGILQFPLIVQTLSTIRSQAIDTIDITLWFTLDDGVILPLLEGADWEQLDTMLDHKIFKGLRVFRVDIFPKAEGVPTDFFIAHLPRLDKRGILQSPNLRPKSRGKQKQGKVGTKVDLILDT